MFVVGIDFGTLSGRAVVVRVADGAERRVRRRTTTRTASSTGSSPPRARSCRRDWALQDPADWLEALGRGARRRWRRRGSTRRRWSASAPTSPPRTPLRRSATGRRCASSTASRGRPHAYPKLWKHHAAQAQAERVTAVAAERGEPWLARYGGRISSEWQFAKALQVLEEDPEVYARDASAGSRPPTGSSGSSAASRRRSVGAAGYKGIFQDGALPDARPTSRRSTPASPTSSPQARAPAVAARRARRRRSPPRPPAWTGLREGIAVAVGNVDAHVTAPAARSIEPGHMLAVMGTSTCHVMNGEVLAEVPGMCGVVDGGITPGLLGYEAGQSGVGDIFAWFVEQQLPAGYHDEARERGLDAARAPVRARGRAGASARTGSSRSTGTAATAPCSSTTS